MTDPTLLSDIDAALARLQPIASLLDSHPHGPVTSAVVLLTRCRAALADYIGTWAVYPPPLASDGPCAAGWVDREGDVQP